MDLVLGIIVAFHAGEPIDMKIIGTTHSLAECQTRMVVAIETVRKLIPPEVEVQGKCYDFGHDGLVKGGFGTHPLPAGESQT